MYVMRKCVLGSFRITDCNIFGVIVCDFIISYMILSITLALTARGLIHNLNCGTKQLLSTVIYMLICVKIVTISNVRIFLFMIHESDFPFIDK